MFRALFGNTLISSAAFFAVGLVGLLLVPVLLGTYGLAGLGLIMLARMFLPGAGLGLFDFGISEIATQVVATARVDEDWSLALRRLAGLTLLTLAMAFAVALPLLLFAPPLARAFDVAAGDRAGFAQVLQTTALLLPLLFLGLLAEGSLKGYENFRALRAAEVLSTLCFAAAAVVACRLGADFRWIVWLHLASQALRVGLITRALRRSAGRSFALQPGAVAGSWSFLLERARAFFLSRVLGTVQHQMPPMVVGLTIGPAGVGLYDTLARLPRFAKSVLSVLNTTLLPLATRLHAAGDDMRLKLLSGFGFTLLPTLVLPPLAAAAVLAGPTLQLWLGEGYARHAPWLALFWALPALNTLVSFQNFVLMSRMSYVHANLRTAAAQVGFQYLVSLALAGLLAQFAYIVGYVGATVLLFGWQLTLARRELGMPVARVLRLLALCAGMGVVVAGSLWGGVVPAGLSLPAFAGAFLALTVALMALTIGLFLGPEERALLRRVVDMAVRRGR